MAVQKELTYEIQYGKLETTNGISVFDPEFDNVYFYDGNDLGCTIHHDGVTLKVWAPTAEKVEVNIFKTWNNEADEVKEMTREDKGVWVCHLPLTAVGSFYTYSVEVEGLKQEAVDPYAKLVGVNGDRAYIGSMTETSPEGFNRMPSIESPTDAVIYELHVRDFSLAQNSGMENKGKFVAFTESETTNSHGDSTGLDYIKELGVTHVQLLPIYDYSTDSVDETRLDEEQFNWGYDPKNYNAVEGSYSTNPYDPYARVKELKQAIHAMHEKGLRVIMDVVYNHVYDVFRMNFTKIVPGYYFRYDENRELGNGSACGNDTASERKMMRKFMVDSIVHWATEYNLDGFRFDLMGLHDVETMNEIRQALDEIDSSIIVIGEGWDLATLLPHEEKAAQFNATKLPRIAHFNDGLRDSIKGHALYEKEIGFVNGAYGREDGVKAGIAGAVQYNSHIHGFTVEPVQCVSYMEAHDNHTAWDKIEITNPNKRADVRKKMHQLGTNIVLTSQGITFLHAGQEFFRTKFGVENSYKSHSAINQIDWNARTREEKAVEETKELLTFRRNHPALRLRTADDIRNHLVFEKSPSHVISYTLRNHAGGDKAKHIWIIHNGHTSTKRVEKPFEAKWHVAFGSNHVTHETHDVVSIAALSTVIFIVEE